jgi:hypothetical protein
MEKFLTFEDYTFIKESQEIFETLKTREKVNYKKLIIDALIESGSLEETERIIVESAVERNLYDNLWEGTLSESQIQDILNEESVFSKVADWGKKKIELAKEKGKQAVDATTQKVAKIASSIGSFVGMITKAISSFLKSAWDYIKGQVEKKYSAVKEKAVKDASKSLKGKGDKLSEETVNLGSTVKHSVAWCTKGAVDKVGGLVKSAGEQDVSESFVDIIEEGFWTATSELIKAEGINFVNEFKTINEGSDAVKIPFLSKIAEKMNKLPFFKQFTDIKKTVKKVANSLLERLSQFVAKVMNGPGPFEFIVFGTIVGLVVAYKLEHTIHHGVEHVVKELGSHAIVGTVAVALPFIGWILNMMFYTATGLWYWSTGQAVLGVIKSELGIEDAIKKADEETSKVKPENDEKEKK